MWELKKNYPRKEENMKWTFRHALYYFTMILSQWLFTSLTYTVKAGVVNKREETREQKKKRIKEQREKSKNKQKKAQKEQKENKGKRKRNIGTQNRKCH